MKFYETGLIIDPQLDEAGFDGEIKKVTDIIESNSGQIEKVDRWGLRRLAYQIKKKSQGFYTFIYYNAPPEVPRMIETMLRIDENCLRFMTIVPDFKPDFEKPAQKEKPRPQPEASHEPEEAPADEDKTSEQDKSEEEGV